MSVKNVYGDFLRQQWRACRKLLPEAVRRFLVWEPTGKQLFQFSGLLFGFGLLGLGSLSKLIAVLVLFTVGFAALLLITLMGVAAYRVTQGGATWARIRVPQGYRAGFDWMFEVAYSLQMHPVWLRWAPQSPRACRGIHGYRLRFGHQPGFMNAGGAECIAGPLQPARNTVDCGKGKVHRVSKQMHEKATLICGVLPG